MWKRDEAVKPTGSAGPGSAPATPTSAPPAAEPTRPQPNASHDHRLERSTVNIGKSVVIKGELNGSEDLTIEGQVEGKIELRQNVLTIGPNGKIKAQLFAKSVIILGEVIGNVTATEKVDIRDNGSVDGDIASPRVAIAEGAHFRGSIDMQRSGGSKASESRSEQKSSTPSQSTQTVQAGTPAGAAR
jgi:cytoskeletal protein CcmA (bactofilin family)